MEISPNGSEPYRHQYTWFDWFDFGLYLLANSPVVIILALLLFALVRWCAVTLYAVIAHSLQPLSG